MARKKPAPVEAPVEEDAPVPEGHKRVFFPAPAGVRINDVSYRYDPGEQVAPGFVLAALRHSNQAFEELA